MADGTSGKLLPDYLRLQASSMMKWLGMCLYRHEDAENDHFHKRYRGELTHYPVHFSIQTFREEDLLSYIPVAMENQRIAVERRNRADGIRQRPKTHEHSLAEEMKLAVALMEAQYPHEAATTTTSYQSVSEISGCSKIRTRAIC